MQKSQKLTASILLVACIAYSLFFPDSVNTALVFVFLYAHVSFQQTGAAGSLPYENHDSSIYVQYADDGSVYCCGRAASRLFPF